MCSHAFVDTDTGESSLIATSNEVKFEHESGTTILDYAYQGIELAVFLVCRDQDDESVSGSQDDVTKFKFIIQSRCYCPRQLPLFAWSTT